MSFPAVVKTRLELGEPVVTYFREFKITTRELPIPNQPGIRGTTLHVVDLEASRQFRKAKKVCKLVCQILNGEDSRLRQQLTGSRAKVFRDFVKEDIARYGVVVMSEPSEGRLVRFHFHPLGGESVRRDGIDLRIIGLGRVISKAEYKRLRKTQRAA